MEDDTFPSSSSWDGGGPYPGQWGQGQYDKDSRAIRQEKKQNPPKHEFYTPGSHHTFLAPT